MRVSLLVLVLGLLVLGAGTAVADEEIIEIVDELDEPEAPQPAPVAPPEPVAPPPPAAPAETPAAAVQAPSGNAVPAAVVVPAQTAPTAQMQNPCCPVMKPIYCSPCAPRKARRFPCPPKGGRYYGSCSYPGPIFDFGG